jgi:uncharacterized protein YndB with AHSA1/START domain
MSVPPPEPACLLIADISGYTDYLAGVELDHAQDILADLVDTVVGSLRPTVRLSKLEGDAAFAWSPTPTVDGSLLQDAVERTYVAFRRRLRDIGRASRCECNACVRIPSLDLKFVVHHGTVVRQRMAGREELVGRDVILIHRLLKNRISDATGIAAYAAYTSDCIAAMGVPDPAAQGLRAHREWLDVIGEVELWVRDLGAVWEADESRASNVVTPARAHWVHRYRTSAPPALAWEYVTSPLRRPQWGGMSAVEERSASGRRGAGTVNHCVHGRDVIVEEVLDWRPYEHLTTRYIMPVEGSAKLTMTESFRALPDGGTEIEIRVAGPRGRDHEAFGMVLEGLQPQLVEAADALVSVLAEEVDRRRAELAPEPPTPVTRARHVTEPVVGAARTADSRTSRSSDS